MNDIECEIDKLIDIAIAEDLGTADITSEACIPKSVDTSARFFMKQAGIIAGLPFLSSLFQKIDKEIKTTLYVKEGSHQKAGALIAKVSGPARAILSGERVALNFLQHACGVATLTDAYVRKIAGIDCAILDTRKTLPGLRSLEKYAVRVGGGINQRFRLDEQYIIKHDHLIFIQSNKGNNIQEAVKKVRKKNTGFPVAIEIHNPEELNEALETDVETIMLRRMFPYIVARCVKKIKKTDKKVFVESLEAITLDTVRAYAETGVDGIAIGAITHSAEAIDIRMRLTN